MRSRLPSHRIFLPIRVLSASILLIALPAHSQSQNQSQSQPVPAFSHAAADLAIPASPSIPAQPDLERQGLDQSGLDRVGSAIAQTESSSPQDGNPAEIKKSVEIKSPVLEKWQRQVPNVLDEIQRDPSFRTRARLGLSYFPSTSDSLGWNAGIEDLFLLRAGKTGLTLSGDYQATFSGKRRAGGANLRYYLLPLGGYVNIAPLLGYRYLETPRYVTDGLEVGFRVQVVPSRTGATDLSLTQTWVNPQHSDEVGITTLSFGYALTHHLRLSTDVQKQNSKPKRDTRFGLSLEWMF